MLAVPFQQAVGADINKKSITEQLIDEINQGLKEGLEERKRMRRAAEALDAESRRMREETERRGPDLEVRKAILRLEEAKARELRREEAIQRKRILRERIERDLRPLTPPKITSRKSPSGPESNSRKHSISPKSNSTGSGFFVSKLGHIVTNQHVVNKCKSVTVGDNANNQVIATVLESDKRNDLALLRISNMRTASAETKSLVAKLGLAVTPLASQVRTPEQ